MPWSACCGVYDLEIFESRVVKNAGRVKMPDRCDAANGETCHIPHKTRIRPCKRLSGDLRSLYRIDLISPGCDEQNGPATIFTAKDDGLGDLVDLATCLGGRGCSCAGFAHHLHDLKGDIGGFQCRANAFQAFTHASLLTVPVGDCNGPGA